MSALSSAIHPPSLQFCACTFSPPPQPEAPSRLQPTVAALAPAAHTLPDSVSFAEPSPSADRAHSESPLSASGFGIRPPGRLWPTAVNGGHLLISLFGLPGYI